MAFLRRGVLFLTLHRALGQGSSSVFPLARPSVLIGRFTWHTSDQSEDSHHLLRGSITTLYQHHYYQHASSRWSSSLIGHKVVQRMDRCVRKLSSLWSEHTFILKISHICSAWTHLIFSSFLTQLNLFFLLLLCMSFADLWPLKVELFSTQTSHNITMTSDRQSAY